MHYRAQVGYTEVHWFKFGAVARVLGKVYEVTCPSCHVVVSSPFVRVGAVVTCTSCQHRYLIDQSHIRHVPSSARAGGEGAAKPAPAEAGTIRPGGIQDLSAVMRVEAERERDSQFNDYDTIAPEPDKPPVMPAAVATAPPMTPAPAPPVRTIPQRTKQQKAIRSGYLLAAGVAVSIAILGVGIMLSFSGDAGPGPQTRAEPEPDPGPVYDGPIFQGLPMLHSVLLQHDPWEQPNRPFVSQPQTNTDVYVADDELVPAEAGVIEYVGRVVSTKPGVIMDGELSISLVNPQGIEKASTTAPLSLISHDHSLLLRMPIPANLDPTALHPAWSITIDDLAESAVFLEDLDIQTESSGADTIARLTIGNDSGEKIQSVTLIITAWDPDAQPLRRWRVQWDLPMDVADYVEFFTRTAVNPSWNIKEWTVTAAAR